MGEPCEAACQTKSLQHGCLGMAAALAQHELLPASPIICYAGATPPDTDTDTAL